MCGIIDVTNMKIAISGLNVEEQKKLIKRIQSVWPLYASPLKTIFDESEDDKEPEDDDKFKELVKEMNLNEHETNNFRGWYLLQSQFEKYKNQKYIVYNGSPVDLLCDALLLADNGLVSDEYMEKVIYYHKRYMQPNNLDVVWWMPNKGGTESIEDEIDKKIEQIYNNLFNNYQTKFDSSPLFNQTKCTAFIRFETTEYMTELQDLIDQSGNLYQEAITNIDEEELKARLSRYPDLYQIWIDAQNAKLVKG